MWSSTTAAARGPIRRIPKVNRCLTEGRKAFLGRYASLESGEECARWERVLSALLDGEAKAKDAQALRGHLRSCAGCRATLKALHEGGTDLRVLFPVPLVVGQQVVEQHDATAHLVLRVYEAVVGGAHERATASVLRVQAFVESASTTKVAAVAASAAAVAGGGTVAVEEVREREGVSPPVRTVASKPPAAPAAAAPPTAASSVTQVAASSARAAQKVADREQQRAAAQAEARRRAAARRREETREAARAAASGAAFGLGAPTPAPASTASGPTTSAGAAGSGGGGTSGARLPAEAAFGP